MIRDPLRPAWLIRLRDTRDRQIARFRDKAFAPFEATSPRILSPIRPVTITKITNAAPTKPSGVARRDLKTVTDFAESGPFTQSQLRWWIFSAAENGLDKSGAIVRIGRRVYIDTDAFERWIEAQNFRVA